MEITDELLERCERLHVLGVTMPVLALEDLLATSSSPSTSTASTTGRSCRSPARCVSRSTGTSCARTQRSPYASAFLTLVEALGVAPACGHTGAEVRLVPPRAG